MNMTLTSPPKDIWEKCIVRKCHLPLHVLAVQCATSSNWYRTFVKRHGGVTERYRMAIIRHRSLAYRYAMLQKVKEALWIITGGSAT